MKFKRILGAAMTAAIALPIVGGGLNVFEKNSYDLTASADDPWTKSQTNTTLGVSAIKAPSNSASNTAWTGNYVYYGKYDGTNPTKYRVLDPNSTAFGVEGGSLFLDCDTTLYNSKFHDSSKVWSCSTVQSSLNGNGFLKKSDNLTDVEENAIALSKTSITSGRTSNLNHTNLDSTTGEQVFLLDVTEANNPAYGYVNNNTRNKRGLSSYGWWLRSPNDGLDDEAGFVYANVGYFTYSYVYDTAIDVSPAFNVDLSSVLFSSVITSPNAQGYCGEYKLTLKYSSDSYLGIKEHGDITRSGNTITVPYSIVGTEAPNAQNVSFLVTNGEYNAENASIIHYETKPDTSEDKLKFTLPDTWGANYHAYIIAEVINGEKETDYASKPVEITIPEQVCHYSPAYEEYKQNGLTFHVYEGDHAELAECDVKAESVEIPSEFEGLPVTEIGESAFNSCKKLTEIIIPESITTIGASAFWGCTNLESVTIPKSVTDIGKDIFKRCSAIKEIRGYKDTEAEKYAVSKDIAFVIISQPAVTNVVIAYKDSETTTSATVVTTTTAVSSASETTTTAATTLGKAKDVSVDKNGVVSWTPADNADHYHVVKIIDGKRYTGADVTGTSYSFKNKPRKDYEVYVTAYDKNGRYRRSDCVSVELPLGYVDDLTAEGRTVSWNAAKNAAYYKIGKKVGDKVWYVKTEETEYTLNSVPEGGCKVFVVAFDGKGNRTWGKKLDINLD